MPISQFDMPWHCRKDFWEEKLIAVYLTVDDNDNVLNVMVNGCDDMDGSNECHACRERVRQKVLDLSVDPS